MNQIPVSKLTDLGMLRGNEAALNLQSQSIRSAEPQEIGGSQCDLPQHHCCAHLVFVFWSLREKRILMVCLSWIWVFVSRKLMDYQGRQNFRSSSSVFVRVFSCGFASPLGSHYSSVIGDVGYKLEVSSEPSVGLEEPGL